MMGMIPSSRVVGGWLPRAALLFVILGGACAIGGGLLSAVSAPAPSYHSSWAVAYLVLVAGVAQVVLGLGQATVVRTQLSRRILAVELLSWNLGNAAVLAGTLLAVPAALYLGTALLIATLVLILLVTRHAPRRLALTATRVIIVLLLISMPIGILLQAMKH
jgi:uncharacterized membrane protein